MDTQYGRKRRGRKPLTILFSLLLAGFAGTAYYYAFQANTQLKPILPPLAAERHLQQWLYYNPAELMDHEVLYHLGLTGEIYRRVNNKLLWLNNYELNEAGEELFNLLNETSADGLYDYQYHLAYIQQRLHNLPNRPKDATALDIVLTDAFISYAEDVLGKKLTPAAAEYFHRLQPVSWRNEDEEPTYREHGEHSHIVSLISEHSQPWDLNKTLANLQPQHEGYQQLKENLRHYQNAAQSNRWQELGEGPTLKVGMRDSQIKQLRELLKTHRDYPLKTSGVLAWFSSDGEELSEAESMLFDESLSASLKQFQRRHGLYPSGQVDKKTRAQLNVPLAVTVKQLALNLKRWRELPADLGKRYLWVNLNDFRLDLIYKGESILNMKVIVGKPSRQTPVMHQSINSIVLNPYWNVPRRIMIRDILPQAKKDPSYLSERNIRIIDGWQSVEEVPIDNVDWDALHPRRFPYRLRQDAGPDNALGAIKFVIPNDQSIYLHDTNHPELFSEDQRALSSGCVRVSEPLKLAETLLAGKRGWNRKKIESIIAAGETTYVRLPESIPTYLLYWTAWVDSDGVLQIRDDMYGSDEKIFAGAEKKSLALNP